MAGRSRSGEARGGLSRAVEAPPRGCAPVVWVVAGAVALLVLFVVVGDRGVLVLSCGLGWAVLRVWIGRAVGVFWWLVCGPLPVGVGRFGVVACLSRGLWCWANGCAFWLRVSGGRSAVRVAMCR